ncbi:MAG: ECF transporter S component [Tenericutes bacterium]|nr:ECF transporter S component [Mycoplasmatota bacterium]
MEIYLIAGAAVIIALTLMFFLGKNTDNKKSLLIVSGITLFFIVFGITYAYLFLITIDGEKVPLSDIIIANIIVIVVYVSGYFILSNLNQKTLVSKKVSTYKITIQALLIGIASVLMLISFPVMPAAPYLKVELSALIIFMTLIWFDFKTAVMVSFVTNLVHFFMPSSAPVIPLLDEMMNFMATMIFILPAAIFLKKDRLLEGNKQIAILILTTIGFVATTIIMVLYNQYINLPYIYNIQMSFNQVLLIFGVFNIIKWGLNAVVINLTWKRFYLIGEQFLNK